MQVGPEMSAVRQYMKQDHYGTLFQWFSLQLPFSYLARPGIHARDSASTIDEDVVICIMKCFEFFGGCIWPPIGHGLQADVMFCTWLYTLFIYIIYTVRENIQLSSHVPVLQFIRLKCTAYCIPFIRHVHASNVTRLLITA